MFLVEKYDEICSMFYFGVQKELVRIGDEVTLNAPIIDENMVKRAEFGEHGFVKSIVDNSAIVEFGDKNTSLHEETVSLLSLYPVEPFDKKLEID